MQIIINGIIWNIKFVNPYNLNLITDTGIYTLGMTDNNIKTIFINNELHGDLLLDVLTHELCHAYMFSYNIKYNISEEEHICQFVGKYCKPILDHSKVIL